MVDLYTLIAYDGAVSRPPLTVAETPLFVQKAAVIFGEDERAALITFVAWNPEAGDLIPGTGGARVIYYFHNESMPVFLLSAYAKSKKVDLSEAERNALRKLVPLLVRGYLRGSVQ